ncbi:uncharacterized protein LOC129872289 isoform X1 [Solanum dulcamara]|uniref:uncharacterized protein LOC129872289 isoform X1 n=2 Tax=Solanum dulcamara TaxID=45834 RepID=UPI002485C47D|nr:uncharacterized protein LOC129872289 isoform X1 [Solanum dulcamara]
MATLCTLIFPKVAQSRGISTTRAVLTRDSKMKVPYEQKPGQSRLFHKLPSGLDMEVLFQRGSDPDEEQKRSTKNPPLVFVHGSFHASWCWAEHWLPFFSQNGYDCYALSLLGQGESDSPAAAVAGTLQTHAGDIADFIHKEIKLPPVLLGHSFGGLIVQYYIANIRREAVKGSDSEKKTLFPNLSGAVLICSVPPSGNSGLVWRYLFSKPLAAFKVTWSLAAKAFQTSLPLCKETFFSAAMEDQLVARYQQLMIESSRMPLFDLRKLNASLPVPRLEDPAFKVFVVGAKDDFIVDMEGLNETGSFYGVPTVCIEGVAHDIMIDCSWRKGAQSILSWLNGLNKAGTQI